MAGSLHTDPGCFLTRRGREDCALLMLSKNASINDLGSGLRRLPSLRLRYSDNVLARPGIPGARTIVFRTLFPCSMVTS